MESIDWMAQKNIKGIFQVKYNFKLYDLSFS